MPNGGKYGKWSNVAHERIHCKQNATYVVDILCYVYNYFRVNQDYTCSVPDTGKLRNFSKPLANCTSLNGYPYGEIRVNNSLHNANSWVHIRTIVSIALIFLSASTYKHIFS